MSVIKQISVYDGSSWNTNDIGAAASNVSLSTNAAGASNVQTALNNLVGTSKLTGSRAIITNASGVLNTSSVTSTQLGYLSGTTANLQTQINTLNTNLENKVSKSGDTMTSPLVIERESLDNDAAAHLRVVNNGFTAGNTPTGLRTDYPVYLVDSTGEQNG